VNVQPSSIVADARSVIDVENVSMAYRLYPKPVNLLKEALFGGVHHDTFWALRDISLSICEGQRVGIVGQNGAGKSTLLQIIAGNLKPVAGKVNVKGRISSLLSMVPTWNGEETGLQNIRFNLLLQGTSESKISQLVEEIIDFTELGPFIFHPVKTYSSGMSARLTFAIATATEPDILIIDEVLGAGDGYFAGKAYKRMHDFCARGRALLFVSHSVAAVQQLCNKVIWMQNGSIRMQGDADFVLKQYELDFRKSEDESLRTKHIAASAQRAAAVSPDEAPNAENLRFRIVARDSRYFSATHFVRSIQIHGVGPDPIQVPMELADLSNQDQTAILQVMRSEWGRLHERNGNLSRLLTRSTGRQLGGHFTIRLPSKFLASNIDLRFEIESSCTDEREHLSIEALDMIDGCWRAMTALGRHRLGGEWWNSEFAGNVPMARSERIAKTIEELTEKAKPDVEILEVYLISNGDRTMIIKERQPFQICVKINFRRSPAVADVGIKISRADGVYVFWSSSGLSGVNLNSPAGENVVIFHFDPNDLGAEEYLVNAQINDGWSYPNNYPYGQVFARAINAARFRITKEMPEVDFGVLNKRVRVEVASFRKSQREEVVAQNTDSGENDL
jgi:ABC-type polysaccharide/polyol phosphate transport system ATPase subunit